MIHHSDEKVFRFVELTCYWMLVLGFPAVKVIGRKHSEYFMPGLFTLLGATGLAFMTRYFIYAEPHLIFRRARATVLVLTRQTKAALVIGYAMCTPMFALGCIGLFSPHSFERMIRTVSPMRFFLE
jgi:hypothetical protein